MTYICQYVQKPKYERGTCFQDYLEEVNRHENKVYVPILKGPLFSPLTTKKKWNKKVRSLQVIAARAAGQAFNCGVWEALRFMQNLPCSIPVVKMTHKYLELASHEWAEFALTERHYPWLDPFGARIKRVCKHYRRLNPDVDDDLLED